MKIENTIGLSFEQSVTNERPACQRIICLVSPNNGQPGCGSTTIAQMLSETMPMGDRYFVSIGAEIRKMLATQKEAAMRSAEKDGTAPTDPKSFDLQFYTAALEKKFAVIEGKAATRQGPGIIGNSAYTISIQLNAPLITSVVRVMRRDGISLEEIVKNPMSVVGYFSDLEARQKHIAHIKDHITDEEVHRADVAFQFDTSRLRPEEIVTNILGASEHLKKMEPWEVDCLYLFVEKMKIIWKAQGLSSNTIELKLRPLNIYATRMFTSYSDDDVAHVRQTTSDLLFDMVSDTLKSLQIYFFELKDGSIISQISQNNAPDEAKRNYSYEISYLLTYFDELPSWYRPTDEKLMSVLKK